jgi:AcrR family transcriptional regulator
VPRAGLTAERLTTAAAELADAEGLEAVSVAALARRFGVRPASLYSHVAGTEALRVRVALLALEEMADLAVDAVAGRSGRDALAALADVYRDYARAHPGRYDAAQLRLDPQTAAASDGPRHAALNRAVLRGYRLGEPDETHAVRIIGAAVHGFVRLEAGGGFDHSRPSPAETWTRVVDALDTLFTTWSRPTP